MKPFFVCLALSLACPMRADLNEANALLAKQQYEQAAQSFEAAGKQAQKKKEAWRLNNWGLCLIRLDKAGQAGPILEEAVAADPKNFTAWANLGAAYEKIGDRVKAADTYGRALDLLHSENKALAAGKAAKDPEEAEDEAEGTTQGAEAFSEAPCTLKETPLKAALKTAGDLLQAEKFQEASDAYSKIGMCSGAKREGWKLNNWGLALIRLGNFKDALPRLKKSVDVYPDNPKAWNNLGVAYENLGLSSYAKDAYAKASSPMALSPGAEMDSAKVALNQLKLDFNAEKRKWEASK
jgi:Flp pilus assembly protein TadD